MLDFSSLSSTNTYLHDTRCRREKGVEKKGRKEKKGKGECLSCDSAVSKQRYLHLTRTNTNENGLPRDAHQHSRRQPALCTTVYLSDTISGSDVYKKLGTCPRGGMSKARVTFMRDLLRKTRYFPASAAANKGGHISSPLYSLPCNANFRFSLRKTGHNDASYARPRKITTTSREKWRNLESGNELNVIKTQKISCPTLV